MIFAIFLDDENIPVFIDLFIMEYSEEEISLADSFNNPGGRLSRPATFDRCSFISGTSIVVLGIYLNFNLLFVLLGVDFAFRYAISFKGKRCFFSSVIIKV